jgi:[NiFe] hydrogenase diaphorase moiety large subunit
MRPGVYEVPFGVTLREVFEMCGAESPFAAAVGGPSGQLVGEKAFDRTICFDDLATGGAIMVFRRGRDILEIVSKFLEFFIHESCGYCTPCRAGNVLLKERVDKVIAGLAEPDDLLYLEELAKSVKATSRCGLGQTSPNPVLSTLENFDFCYEDRIQEPQDGQKRSFDIHEALSDARKLTGRSSVHFEK